MCLYEPHIGTHPSEIYVHQQLFCVREPIRGKQFLRVRIIHFVDLETPLEVRFSLDDCVV